jgi:hypothetical protein
MPVVRVMARPIAATGLGVAAGLAVAESLPADAATLGFSLAAGEAVYLAVIWFTFRGALVDLIATVRRALRSASVTGIAA